MPITPTARRIPTAELQWWGKGAETRSVLVDRPAVASWDARGTASQIRLAQFLDAAARVADGGPITPAWLEVDVTLPRGTPIDAGHDVENYLTPLAHRLARTGHDFVLVIGRKRVGTAAEGMARVATGRAAPCPVPAWSFGVRVSGSAGSKAWKLAVRGALSDCEAAPRVGGIAIDPYWPRTEGHAVESGWPAVLHDVSDDAEPDRGRNDARRVRVAVLLRPDHCR